MKKALRIVTALLLGFLLWVPLHSQAQKYCYPKFYSGCGSGTTVRYLTEFQIGTYLRTSSCDYTNGIDTSKVGSSVISLYRGQSYLIRLKSNSGADMAYFFDFNADGDFDDGGETVGTESNSGAYDSFRSKIVIPKNVKLGTTRARGISVDPSTVLSVGSGCADFTSNSSNVGEVEDYLVTIDAYDKDAYLVNMADPVNYGCANSTQPLVLIIRNFGKKSISGIPVTMKVTDPSNSTTTYTATTSKSLNADDIDTFIMPSTVNMSSTGKYHITAYVNLSGDQDHTNDSLSMDINISPKVKDPSVTGADICGYDKVQLKALTNTTGAKTFWYADKSLIKPIYTGDIYITPKLTRDTMYYVQSEFLNPKSLQTQYVPIRANSTSYFDVHAKNEIVLDSFLVDMAAATEDVSLYYRIGSYQGYETDSSTWIRVGHKVITSSGTGYGTLLNIGNIHIPAGATYGICIDLTSANRYFYYDAGSNTISNGDMDIIQGTTANGKFSSNLLTAGREWDGEIYYHPKSCRSNLLTVKAKVRQGISGMQWSMGKPFNGLYNAGNSFNPDQICPNDTVSYKLSGPTNFNQADYGTKWRVKNVSVTTDGKQLVPDTLITYPTTSSDMYVRVIPSSSLADSQMTINVTFESLVDSCVTTVARVIKVGTSPKANFGFTEVCEGLETTFIDSSQSGGSFMTYHWDFGDGVTATQGFPTHTYAKAGKYTVTLKVTNQAGCFDKKVKTVNVYGKPQINFTLSNQCAGLPTTFIDSTITAGTINKSYWHFGDGSFTSTKSSPTYTYRNPGTYTVTYAVQTTTGCMDTLKKQITIVGKPKASFSFTSNCIGKDVVFTNNTSDPNVTYLWDFGDGVTSTDKNPVHTYYIGGGYSVKLRVTNASGCSDSITSTVAPYAPPASKIGLGKTLCVGSNVSLYDSSNYGSSGFGTRNWDFGDGQTSTDPNPNHAYTSAGSYDVYLRIINKSGCVDSVFRTITVHPLPATGFTAASTVCYGKPLQFTSSNNSGSATYEWDFGDNTAKVSDKNPQHAFATPGAYIVTQKVTDLGCTATKTATITVTDGPKPTWIASLFGSSKVTFTPDDLTYTNYTWYFGDGDSSISQKPSHTYTNPHGTYSVRLVVLDAQGCKGENTIDYMFDGIQNPNENRWGVNIYPNPFSGSTTVSYDLDKKGMVKITVMDMQGREIMVAQAAGDQAAGKHQVSIDGSRLNAGMYILRVIVGNQCYNTPIIQLGR